MIIDVVILSDAKSDAFYSITKQCIDSLYKSIIDSDINFNIYVVESNHNIVYDLPVVTLHLNEKLFNYNKFANYGIRHGCNEYVMFCNNDLIFNKNWINIFKYKYDSMSPICPITKSQQKFAHIKRPIFGYDVAQHISGWCIILKREVWNRIGELNEDCNFWYADNIYAQQLKKYNIDHFLIPTSKVTHINGGSNTLNTLDKLKKKEFTHDLTEKFKNINLN